MLTKEETIGAENFAKLALDKLAQERLDKQVQDFPKNLLYFFSGFDDMAREWVESGNKVETHLSGTWPLFYHVDLQEIGKALFRHTPQERFVILSIFSYLQCRRFIEDQRRKERQ